MTEALAVPERTVANTLAELGTPLPVFRGAEMAQALVAYKDLQRALDASMPDQLMELDGHAFRKKGYWRAVAVAFNLSVEPVDERREVNSQFLDGRDNFGYVVTYRATAPNGRTEPGDGACFAIEKAAKFKCPHPHPSWKGKTLHFPHKTCPDFDPNFRWRVLPDEASEHNVRAHAHTRAFNRAVSNLCGFGEVSAEEMERDAETDHSAEPKSVGNGRTQERTPHLRVEEPAPSTRAAASLGPDQYTVKDVKELKKGEKSGRNWTLFGITVHTGQVFQTFDVGVADAAEDARQKGYAVEIHAEKAAKGDGLKVVSLAPVSEWPAADAEHVR
jgi:hypothetical protein